MKLNKTIKKEMQTVFIILTGKNTKKSLFSIQII